MKSITFQVTICASIITIISGCTSFPDKSDFTDCDLRAVGLQAVTFPKGAQSEFKFATAPDTDLLFSNAKECESNAGHFDVLTISGGGADGAFGAGFLATWIENHPLYGPEPFHPCIVAGISTGAVMGSYVYLATSGKEKIRNTYLEKLEHFYQELDDDNLVSKYSKIRLLFNSSQYSVEGIRETLKKLLNADLLTAVRDEYARSNRKLWVGATDLYTGKFEVIDLTDYTCRIDPNDEKARACYGEAIRASAAIPVVFPPVPINDTSNNKSKLYADGGVRHLMFINAALLEKLPPARHLRVYGVINNTYTLQEVSGGKTIIEIASRDAKVAADQLYRDAAYIVDSVTANYDRGRALRRWATAEVVGSECDQYKNEKLFNPPYQKCLYDKGKEVAQKTGWSDKPIPVETFQ